MGYILYCIYLYIRYIAYIKFKHRVAHHTPHITSNITTATGTDTSTVCHNIVPEMSHGGGRPYSSSASLYFMSAL